ncbi:MAG TPA: aldehyde dehydrogenase family protein [Solirubrobacteraceae bacterium]|jgi:acyl-CoA reductase-like NAD-dependent aldehyde dehydrogenase
MAATVEALSQSVAHVQPLWAQLRVPDRARYLRRAAQAVVDELDELVDLFGRAHDRTPGEVAALELLPAIDGLTWLADSGARALRERRLSVPRGTHPLARARLAFEPLGVVGLLGAADAPFAQPLWQVGAALLAGNGVVLAPHPRGALGAERIARLFARASLPEGRLALAPAGGVLEPEGLAKAFVPGSEEGRLAAAACSVAGVPVEIDEGGGAAALVLADAAVGRSARGVANAAFAGGGRTRGAAKRAWVARGVHDAWVERVVAAAGRRAPVGAGEAVAELLADAVASGARLRCGGPLGAGAFAPAVLTGVSEDMRIAREIADAPVLAVTGVGSSGEAIAAANASGLCAGASVWTASPYEGARIARELRSGPTWLNDHVVAPALPAVTLAPGLGGAEGVRAYARPRPITWSAPGAPAFWWGPYDERLAAAARAVIRLRSVRDRDRERAWREGALPIARVVARALRHRRG